MPKVTIEFDTSDHDEEKAAQIALASKALSLELWQFKQDLVTAMNDGYYQGQELSGENRDMAEKVLRELSECLDNCGILQLLG